MAQRITFTTFMSFVLANGPSKLSQVRKALSIYTAAEYRKADWYLDLRKPIHDCFSGLGTITLDRALKGLTEPRKKESHEAVVDGLKQWLKGKRISTFEVAPAIWSTGVLDVTVNPEYGLVINGQPFVVKLYMKEDKPDQRRLNPLLHMLERTHGDKGKAMILDCRRGRHYVLTQQIKNIDLYLEGEARSFVAMWEALAAA
jgi:hypothetical protein